MATVTAAAYWWHLGTSPFFGGDEARFGVHAYSIATTGRDLDARFLPLMFRIEEYNWRYQPTLFCLIALSLKLLPLTEWSVRLPTAVIGVLDVVLMYAVVKRLLISRVYAAPGGLMLALTPRI